MSLRETEEMVIALKEKEWVRDHPHAKKKYDIAVIGLGNVGTATYNELPKLSAQVIPVINKIIPISHDLFKAQLAIWNSKFSRLSFIKQAAVDFKKIKDKIDKFDICIITGDANKYITIDDYLIKRKGVDRFRFVDANIPMIKEIAPHFRKDYEGNVIIATNQTDMLARIFAQYSEIDPRQVIGLNHLDTLRLRIVIEELCNKEFSHLIPEGYAEKTDSIRQSITNVYALGNHQEAFPCYHNGMIGTIPLLNIFQTQKDQKILEGEFSHFVAKHFNLFKEKQDVKDLFEKIDDKSIPYSRRLELHEKLLEHIKDVTTISTTSAILETVKAIMNQESRAITASTPHPHSEKNVFIGLPVNIDRHYIEADMKFIDNLPEQQKELLEQQVKDLERRIGECEYAGKIKSRPLVIPKKVTPTIPLKQENLIFGAGGAAKKVYGWTILGEVKLEIPSIIAQQEKLASCVKVFNYDNEDFVAIGTSLGIKINSLDNELFSKEMLLIDPDGRKGHVRSMLIAGDSLIASHYHLNNASLPDDEKLGYGIYVIDLERVTSKKRIEISARIKGVSGPLAKKMINKQESVIFPLDNELVEYVPRTTNTTRKYSHECAITAISRDSKVIGDSKGMLTFLDDSYKVTHQLYANPVDVAITALEHVQERGNHLLVGDRMSILKYYDLSREEPTEIFSRQISSINPGWIGTRDSEGRNITIDSISPVRDIKYCRFNGNSYVLIGCERDLIAIPFEEIIKSQKKKSSKIHLPCFQTATRAIYSLDFRGAKQ